MPGYSANQWMKYVKTEPIDVEICDVTLRDGEQTPGVSFTKEEKIDIARTLDEIGVEVIEAGLPRCFPGRKRLHQGDSPHGAEREDLLPGTGR